MKTDDQYNAEWCLKWLEEVEKELGVKSVVYCAKWAWNLYLAKAEKETLSKLTAYPVWWAAYNDGVEPKRNVIGWDEWDVWQYSSKGAVSGVKGKVDVNWMAGGQLSKLQVL
jgi:GH25 family lysozyme M1 (1,4-beta-N-acetylmuramidase)